MGLVAHSLTPPKETSGPYRDITAAVRYAASQNRMAVVSADSADPAHWTYTLTSTRDETVLIELRFPTNPDPSAPIQPTNISARITPFGNPARENDLVRDIRDRLDALRKTGIAPGTNAS